MANILQKASRSKKEVFFIISIGTKFLGIKIESPVVEEDQDVRIILVDHFNENDSPSILKRDYLSQLLDVKAQKVAIILEELAKLKVEKDRVLASIKKRSKSLEVATQIHYALWSYSSKSNVGKRPIVIVPNPIMHHEYRTIKPLVLNVHMCPVCNMMFHCCDIVVVSCQCLYHSWCLGFHLQLSTTCRK
jgi:hypothetical protein